MAFISLSFAMKYLPLVAVSALFIGCATKTPTPTKDPATPKIALVLGGGGAKGFAHVGVIEALEAHHIKPDIIIGTSSGAMIGAIYASGKSASELRHIALNLDENSLIDLAPSKQGLIEGQKLADYINTQVNHSLIEKLPIRFMPVATDNKTHQAVGFSTGDTGQAVRASASVPKLFIAPRLPKNGNKYSDGGQTALVPARFAKSLGADVVISVDVLAHRPTPTKSDTPTTAHIYRNNQEIGATWGKQSIKIPLPFGMMGDELGAWIDRLPKQATLSLPNEMTRFGGRERFWGQFEPTASMDKQDTLASDIVIRPDLSAFSVFDSQERLTMMDVGKQTTLLQIHSIKQHIQHKTPQKPPQ